MKRVVRTFLRNEEWKYILVKHHKKWNWVLPWWHIKNWETIFKTLKREIKEELWLEIKILWNKIWLTENDDLKEKPLPLCIYKLDYKNRMWNTTEKMEYIFLSEIKSWIIKVQEEEIFEFNSFTKEEILSNASVYEQTKEILKLLL